MPTVGARSATSEARPETPSNGEVRTKTRSKVIEVPGYGGSTRREPLEMVIHGPAGAGKTTLATTLPGPAAWVLSEPGATLPILTQTGLGKIPRVVARNFYELVNGIEKGHLKHGGIRAFIGALPESITWIVVDTLSSILVSQHAIHLQEAEEELEKKKAVAAKGREPGLDKFQVLDKDLNRARRLQTMLQESGRNILYLAHTNAIDTSRDIGAQSTTAGRPIIPGQFRPYMEAWASAVLYLKPDQDIIKDGKGRLKKVMVPVLPLEQTQLPMVKHKWGEKVEGAMKDPDLGELLGRVGEWPR